MIEYVRHEARLNRRDQNGKTKRYHLERGARSKRPEIREPALADLEGPDPPHGLLYLLGWFVEVRQGRRYSVEGDALPLAWSDLHAWCAMMDRTLTQSEAWALMQLDRADRNPGEKGD
ncbi:MAG: phage tail assembly chaperone [Solirubrobacterales bacterium]